MRYGFFSYYYSYFYIMLIPLAITLFAQIKIKSTYAKYSNIKSGKRITGAEAAMQMLREHGINDVEVRQVSGTLSDFYDPRTKTVNLSEGVFNNTSISAIGVACHECGHAVQHAENYAPVKLRTAAVPLANIGTNFSYILFIIGIALSNSLFLYAGIIAFSFIFLFQLITLPVEFNASRRAMADIRSMNFLYDDEADGARKVLTAAAMTYVAAMLTALFTLIRYILIARDRRN